MDELELFDALKQLEYGQVMIQVTEIGSPYFQKGVMVCWDESDYGRLIHYRNKRAVDVCKPSDGTITRWIIKNKSEL